MLKNFALAVLAILVIIVGIAMTKPDTYSVKRTIAIKAAPEKIAPLITDFHQWASWSPWEHLDPAMQRTFSGAPAGKGAIYEWKGNKDVGRGRMEITDATTPASTKIDLLFMEPFESHNTTEFVLVPQGAETQVTWNMAGPMNFMARIMSVFTSMDSMIGKDFEKGLASMKAVAEK
ncbi:SRPBCC family protein [Massilia sp. R2A-15]|uniref:SRPBCC family protein n=1 Tax=Massilia sp. R2A-15 TaxID=3064278 RepID=UPI002735FCB5|nr:SRPBCC family protein [Massilia sp. R2A-15]WLI87465.1 SRPBCC family protein [Massilia sp. R2A-15]